MAGFIGFFALNDRKLSSHMDQNHKTNSYDQMSKEIVNLGIRKVIKTMNSLPTVRIYRILY